MRKHFWCVKGEVELDECDTCGGIWLDDKELEKIRSLYENSAEKMADAEKYFKKLSVCLWEDMEKEKRNNAPWYDKLAYAIFGI